MSVSRPAICLISGPSIPKIRPRLRCQQFHSSPNLCERRRPKHANIKASDMALNKAKNEKMPAEKIFPAYTAAEKEEIKKRYTPAQIAAIEAGERAIDPNDIKKRGMIRTDMYAIPFFDDFSKHRPLLDRLPPYEGPVDPNPRLMDLDEASAEMDRAFEEIKKQHTPPTLGKDQETDDVEYQAKQFPSRLELMKIENEASLLMGSDGKAIPAWKNTKMTAPRLPASFLEDEDGRTEAEKATEKAKGKEEDEVDPRDPDGLYNSLMKQTGMTLDEIFDLKVKILVKHRVVNQTRLGKIASIYCLAIAGDGKGRLGVGEAKGQETEDTMANARITAIRAMHPIPRYENRTIYGDVEGKMSAVEVKLMARPPGFGLRCQHLIFEMARAAGIQDLAARVPRSRNKMNTVKATYSALMKQRIPEEIAIARGKKLVDVRKVYYGGRV